MNNIRPFSQASSSRSSNKPGFQTKLKPRIKGLDNIEDKLNSSNHQEMNNTDSGFFSGRKQSYQHDHHIPNDSQFYQTASQLSTYNFQNHNSQTCVCGDCNCGRHLCKLNNIKPDLSKNTIYKQDFNKKNLFPTKVVFAKEYEKLNGPHLDMNSTQRESFIKKDGDKIQRPIPEDLLKSQGPSQGLTTYKSLFPGYKGQNQYIKPTDNHIRDKFPLRSKSTYADTYINKDLKKDDYKYMNDMLKTGGNWYGKSSYGNFFENPNPEYHAKKVKILEKYNENPNFSKQYQTVYKNDFIPKDVTVCPAKVHLETKARGRFTGTKGSFTENTDFKAMSPEYQAFSTSGFNFA